VLGIAPRLRQSVQARREKAVYSMYTNAFKLLLLLQLSLLTSNYAMFMSRAIKAIDSMIIIIA